MKQTISNIKNLFTKYGVTCGEDVYQLDFNSQDLLSDIWDEISGPDSQ